MRNGIVKMGLGELRDVDRPNEPFLVFGRLDPIYEDGQWHYREELFTTCYEKRYPIEPCDYGSYVDAEDRVVFLYYVDDQCVGQIRMHRNWNAYCYIDDIAVAADHRRGGIGSQLMTIARTWARERGFPGLMLETQDVNLAACRFYRKCGFVIGGVDTMLYTGLGNSTERAVFWYLPFGED